MSDFLRLKSSPVSKVQNPPLTPKQQDRLERNRHRFQRFVRQMERGDVLPALIHPFYYFHLYRNGFREYPDPTGAKEKTLVSDVHILRNQIDGLVGRSGSGYVPIEAFRKDFMAVLQGLAETHNHHDKKKLVHLHKSIGAGLDYLQANRMLVKTDLDAFFGIFGKVAEKALSECKDEVKIGVGTGGWQDRVFSISFSYVDRGAGTWTGLAGEAGLKNLTIFAGQQDSEGCFRVDLLVPLAHPGDLNDGK